MSAILSCPTPPALSAILSCPVLSCLSCPQRNYRTFLLFIYGTSVYIAWTFGVSLGFLFVKHGELEAAAAARPPGQDTSSDSLSSNLWLQTLSAYRLAAALGLFSSFWLGWWGREVFFACAADCCKGMHCWCVSKRLRDGTARMLCGCVA